MKHCKTLLFAVLFLVGFKKPKAQVIRFKHYVDTVHKFTFDIPTYWTIKYDNDRQMQVCIPLTKTQRKLFAGCFEGIVFNIYFFNYGLDSLLVSEFEKSGDSYITSDKVSHSVPVRLMKGYNWRGARHDNICGISCNGELHAGAGECQFFYFSSSNITICINTNGRGLKDAVIKQLLTSFKFLN